MTDAHDDEAASDAGPEAERLLDRLRASGAGVNDPNIVGDAGPFDQPPGRDPDVVPDEEGTAGLPTLPPGEEDTAQP